MTQLHTSAPLIAGQELTVRHGSRTVLDHVSLSVTPGEIVTLIGPNGAGKTTLVRVLLGLQQLTGGRVTRRSRLRIGYVPQRLAVDPALPLTVGRFLSLAAPQRGAARQRAIADLLAEVGVPDCAGQQLSALSGGELQRVLLARALIRDPELLVLDEPVQGVDFAGQIALYHLIGEIRKQRGCGILLISHDLHLVMSATDRVLCLNQHLCCSGAPAAVSRHPEYIRLFGPRAASELAIYTHHHDHAHAPDGAVLPVEGCALHGPHEGHHHHHPHTSAPDRV